MDDFEGKNHYEVLGVSRSASPAELDEAQRRLILEAHPDKVPPSQRSISDRRAMRINEAHQTLSDPQRRRRYDAELNATALQSQTQSRRPRQRTGQENRERQRRQQPSEPDREERDRRQRQER